MTQDQPNISNLESRVSVGLLLLYILYGILIIASAAGNMFALLTLYSMVLLSIIVSLIKRRMGPFMRWPRSITNQYFLTGRPAVIRASIALVIIVAFPAFLIYLSAVPPEWQGKHLFTYYSLFGILLGLALGYLRSKLKDKEQLVLTIKYSANEKQPNFLNE